MKTIMLKIMLSTLCVGCASSVEQARYVVTNEYSEIEIRQYDGQILAQTFVQGDFDEVGNEGFRRLAAYIFAKNRDNENKIAMTAPVSQKPIDIKSATVIPNDSGYLLSFVMPAEYKRLDQLPPPVDKRVKLIQIEARRVAVISYSGTWSQQNYLEKKQELENALKSRELEALGPAEWARYNPPFTPWFLRHNEVMIEIRGDQ